MDKFTKEEITLCKQVAEKHRKPIEYGDWYYSKYLKEAILHGRFINTIRDQEIINRDKNVFPLWAISDCLEFLRKKKLRFTLYACELNEYSMSIIDDENTIIVDTIGAKTPLEACLKAVLAVLEEEG